MTLENAVGVCHGVDVKTGEEISFTELCRREIEYLGGVDVVRKYIPFSMVKLREAIKEDRNLNNTSLRTWDKASGFQDMGCGRVIPTHGGITELYRKHRITEYSCSDGVCILKEAARILIEGEV